MNGEIDRFEYVKIKKPLLFTIFFKESEKLKYGDVSIAQLQQMINI